MSDYIEPTQTEFDSNEQVVLDVMTTAYPNILTKPGSVIRELIVRPLSYLYSWLLTNFTHTRDTSTVAYLKTSSSTDNEVADAIASNYFVTRKQGSRSKGVITIIMSTSSTQIQPGSTFEVNGITLTTEKRIIAMGTTYREDDNNQYVPVVPYNTDEGTYVANVPVVTAEEGKIECAPGGEVTMNFSNSVILEALLTAPISGGSDTETDAELMTRAEYNTAESGIGSYYGIKKKLAGSPVNVIDMCLVAGEDAPMTRARNNNVNVSPGGFIDCHVKTYKQYAGDSITVVETYAEATSHHELSIHDTDHAGLFAVTALVANGQTITNYTVSFGSADASVPPSGARLGCDQVLLLSFDTSAAVMELTASVSVLYMPGIYAVQEYMDASDKRFIGQDLKIKAAVPIETTLACKLSYDGTVDDAILAGIKQCIADCVNAYPVGNHLLNFSDMQKVVHQAYPEADLRLPCSMTGSLFLKDGTSAGMTSTAGVLNSAYPVSATEWDPAICYFSLITDNIRLELT